MTTLKPMSPALAAIIAGTYKASCDIVELNKRVPSLALFSTPLGMQSFECGAVGIDIASDSECIWELRNLAAELQARTVVLCTHGHRHGERIHVAVFYAEIAGASWVAHSALVPRMEDEPGPAIVHPVFADGADSSFYPLLRANGGPGTPLAAR